jgi:hypothetical protein
MRSPPRSSASSTRAPLSLVPLPLCMSARRKVPPGSRLISQCWRLMAMSGTRMSLSVPRPRVTRSRARRYSFCWPPPWITLSLARVGSSSMAETKIWVFSWANSWSISMEGPAAASEAGSWATGAATTPPRAAPIWRRSLGALRSKAAEIASSRVASACSAGAAASSSISPSPISSASSSSSSSPPSTSRSLRSSVTVLSRRSGEATGRGGAALADWASLLSSAIRRSSRLGSTVV